MIEEIRQLKTNKTKEKGSQHVPKHAAVKEETPVGDKWIADGVFKPNQVSREPIEEERRDPRFCRLHNYMQHPTTECWVLHRLVHRRIKEGTLELTQPEVQRNPFPNHKGKGVATAMICADPGKDEEESPALLPRQLPPYKRVPSSKICSTSWGTQEKIER
ncbi:hypothetical protein SO802_000651 [Lithocarpus litseifolius]|uniref:Uncharacterized protein n=1 Tax=Lithocarpus litseifolius TaxID=425828 RepID=A0AAW2DS54_9ROSI